MGIADNASGDPVASGTTPGTTAPTAAPPVVAPPSAPPQWQPPADGDPTYEAWKAQSLRYPEFASMFNRYGEPYMLMMYQASQGQENWDNNKLLNAMRLYGYDNADTNGSGPSRYYSGGGGSGGGGGLSTAQQVEAAKATINNQAMSWGLPLTADELTYLASAAITNKWSSEQLTDVLGNLVKSKGFGTMNTDGAISSTIAGIQDDAAKYLVNLSEESAQEYSLRIQSGELTRDGVLNIIREQAKGKYSWATKLIDQGMTTRDVALPLRDTLAQMWEVAPDTLDLMDHETLKFLEARDDNGGKRLVNTDELMLRARKDDRFIHTRQAQNEVSQIGSMLAKYFTGETG